MARLHIFVGSRSDLETVKKSKMTEPLDAADISWALHICSAHRNPDELSRFVKDIRDRGAEMLIGVAGMAAALPGALAGASEMKVPVLGVPLDEDGIDSCLYMPPGVPVATMGVGVAGLRNAGIFACQVLTQGVPSQQEAFHRHLALTVKKAEFDLDKNEIRLY